MCACMWRACMVHICDYAFANPNDSGAWPASWSWPYMGRTVVHAHPPFLCFAL